MYTPEFQAEALGAYVIEGSVTRAAKAVGIHRDTLAKWVAEPASQRLLNELRREHAGKLADKAAAIAVHAVERCRERLDDPKISARDCAVTAGILLDKAAMLREQARQSDYSPQDYSLEKVDALLAEIEAGKAELDRRRKARAQAAEANGTPESSGELH